MRAAQEQGEAVAARDAGRLARAAEEQGGASGRQDGCSVASRPSGAPWGSSRRVRKAALRPKSWPNRGLRPTELLGCVTDNGAYKCLEIGLASTPKPNNNQRWRRD